MAFLDMNMFLSHEVDYISQTIPTVRNIKIRRQTYEIFTMKENLTVITTFKKHDWQFLVSPDSTAERKSFAQYEKPRRSCEWELLKDE